MTTLAQGAVGVALVMAFALLGVTEIGGAMVLLTGQAIAVTVAMAAQNQLSVAGAELILQAVAIPMILRRLANRLGDSKTTAPFGVPLGGRRLAIITGAVLTVLALPLGTLGLPLAVMLLGLLLLATRRHPIAHLTGLTAIQNGLTLAAAGIAWTGAYIVVVPVVPALSAAALWHATRPNRDAL
jgi:hydrogenase-4 membrane subunit HyfE